MNPYARWRQAVWVAGAVVISVFTLAIVLTMMAVVIGWFVAGGSTSTTTGY
ncbi:hypothetical protein [Actinoplanes subtropicus]|uniref:hypothetical protein n=1 Tax=Actinoplanes subtropicus TaxID=543632 RepID=UPI0012F94B0A|nr:hypothetical protein [Actinoplanes subtropicus]